VPRPDWWSRLDPKRPTAYVTLGSSGDVRCLRVAVEAVVAVGGQVLVATAGRVRLGNVGPHVFVANFLPGDLAAARADVVVSNGGSTTGYQALAAGRPLLGIPFNLDQYLFTQAVTQVGAGLAVRAGTADVDGVRVALSRLLAEPSFSAQARRLAADLDGADGPAAFVDFVARQDR
jgi:UDP:flavonoid glycosyltransferase YjiC (YdhE family)